MNEKAVKDKKDEKQEWSAHAHYNHLNTSAMPSVDEIRSERAVTSELLTRGDGDRAMLPMEALSSSTEGANTTRSASSGLILILNFFLWSSSSSDSSEEKKWAFLVVGGSTASRKAVSRIYLTFDLWIIKATMWLCWSQTPIETLQTCTCRYMSL